jgi:hypothetical protein
MVLSIASVETKASLEEQNVSSLCDISYVLFSY